MTIPAEILESMIASLSWMTEYFRWAHEQADIGGSYSPELEKAISLLDDLRKLKENT